MKIKTVLSVILAAAALLFALAGCNGDTPDVPDYPPETLPTTQAPDDPQPQTQTFTFGGLALEISNVTDIQTETVELEGHEPFQRTTFTLLPGAQLTVVDDDAQHAWQVLYCQETGSVPIYDGMEPIDLGSEGGSVFGDGSEGAAGAAVLMFHFAE